MSVLIAFENEHEGYINEPRKQSSSSNTKSICAGGLKIWTCYGGSDEQPKDYGNGLERQH